MIFLFYLFIMFISISGIEKREMTAYKNAEKCIDAINNKVNSNIQDLYDRINLLFPSCKWDDISIVVFDDYIIQPPYDEVVFRSGKGNQDKEFLDRVAKIVSSKYYIIYMLINILYYN